MSDATTVRLLVFRVGDLVCATEVDRVREILPKLPATRLPGAPPAVVGVANVRGTLVTVVEGWRVLNRGGAEGPDAGATAVLVEVGAGRKLAALLVDEVMDLVAFDSEALDQRLALPGLDPTLVRAVGRRAGSVFVVLDADALLAPILNA